HPMLNLAFFRVRSFSVAVCSIGLGTFGFIGALFLLTQFLQFELGFSPLQAGIRMLPAAAAVAVVAPLSALADRALGLKLTTAAGLLCASAGLWLTSHATVAWTYGDLVPGMILIGVGAALVMPTVSGSVMASVPRGDTGVGSATNGTFIQIGGALGVAVIGSLQSTRYQDEIARMLAPHHVPQALLQTITSSIGGALGVAERLGGALGAALAAAARAAFVSGANLGLRVAAVVVLGGFVLALVALPARPPGWADGATTEGATADGATAEADGEEPRQPGPTAGSPGRRR
ncbi:MAG TPA: MFS transporter, partial [Acidimicrobiales bacterium]|nr:MFS transporter [Acidimicrobiales bacterium]